MKKIQAYLDQKPPSKHAVVGYIIRGDDILLGIRKEVEHEFGKEIISGIGGKANNGESDEETLKREIFEEIKVEVQSSTYMGQATYLYPHNPSWNMTVSIFIIDEWSGEPTETDVMKPKWFAKNNLPKDKMWADNLYTIPRVLSGKKINGIFLYNENSMVEEYNLDEV